MEKQTVFYQATGCVSSVAVKGLVKPSSFLAEKVTVSAAATQTPKDSVWISLCVLPASASDGVSVPGSGTVRDAVPGLASVRANRPSSFSPAHRPFSSAALHRVQQP